MFYFTGVKSFQRVNFIVNIGHKTFQTDTRKIIMLVVLLMFENDCFIKLFSQSKLYGVVALDIESRAEKN